MKKIVRFPNPRRQSDIETQAAAWVVLLDKGKPTRDQFKTFLHWYRQDPLHQATFKQHAETWNLALQLPVETIATPLEKSASTAPKKHPRALVAACLALISLGLGFSIQQHHHVGYSTAIQTTNVKREEHILSDGSHLLLDTNTAINIHFNYHERGSVLEKGQAHFIVHQDTKRPFTVNTPLGSITALGTAFTVDTANDQLEVLVMDGKVHIDSAFSRQAIVLETGDHYVISSLGHKKTQLTEDEMRQHAAWQQGVLVFNEEPLARVMQEMRRYHDVNVSFATPEVAAMRIGGQFAIDNLEALLESLRLGFNIAHQFDANQKHITLFQANRP